MAGLADGDTLLAAWEHAAAAPEVVRATVVLAHHLGSPVDDLLDLTLADCARRAIIATIEVFGEVAEVSCKCAHCGEVNEVPMNLNELLSDPPPQSSTVELDGAVMLRALTTRDLLTVATDDNPAGALQRCMVSRPDRQLTELESATMFADRGADIDDAAANLAGLAAVKLRMRCPYCGRDFTGSLDPAVLLWEHVLVTAPALLAEVATLAGAYGWSERDVLGMTAQRRRAYLELAGTRRQGIGS